MKQASIKFQYNHKNRKCEFPECERLGKTMGKAHFDGSIYRRAWCKFHLKGKGRDERVEYAKDIKKYTPKG